MLWEKKTSKQIKENSENRGYLYLRESVYSRDRRTLQRKPKHLGDGSKHKNRNQYIKKKDTYLGKIIELSCDFYLSFEDYIISHIQKENDYLYYILQYSFDEIFFDYIDYLQEIYSFDIQITKDFITNFNSQHNEKEIKKLKTKTYALQSGGFFNIILLHKVFNFECRKIDEISFTDFNNFSARCHDSGIIDEYIQIVLYSKLINTENLQELEEEITQLRLEKENQHITQEDSFESFMRKMHKE